MSDGLATRSGSETGDGSPQVDQRTRLLELGKLVLQLPQLHKLGLQAIQLVALNFRFLDLIHFCDHGSPDQRALIDHCKTHGVRSIQAADKVIAMMEQCIASINDAFEDVPGHSTEDVASAVKDSEVFLVSLQRVSKNAQASIEALPPLPTPHDACSEKNPNASPIETVQLAISVGRNACSELDSAIEQFIAIRSNMSTWLGHATVTTHAGGHLKLYWPPESNLKAF